MENLVESAHWRTSFFWEGSLGASFFVAVIPSSSSSVRRRSYTHSSAEEAAGKMSQATTFWRLAGMTYLEYASKATSVMRGALKEPARTTALAREAVRYNRNVFVGGAPQGKLPVASLKEASATSA